MFRMSECRKIASAIFQVVFNKKCRTLTNTPRPMDSTYISGSTPGAQMTHTDYIKNFGDLGRMRRGKGGRQERKRGEDSIVPKATLTVAIPIPIFLDDIIIQKMMSH